MKIDHLEDVLEIEQLCFPSGTWTKEEYMYELEENPFSKLFVYEIDHKVVGVFGTYILFDQAQIITIGVHPEYQRKGIARSMMEYLLDVWKDEQCEFCTLEVRLSNQSAISLYESFGFIKLNTRKSYYSDGEDAYVMGKAVGESYE